MRAMRRSGTVLGPVLAVGAAALAWSTSAAAQEFPAAGTNVVAAALALLVDLRDTRMTQIVITNAGEAVHLHATLLGVTVDRTTGQTEDDSKWYRKTISCEVADNETTLFKFETEDRETTLEYNCLNGYDDEPVEVRLAPFNLGIMFVTVEDDEGYTINKNQLFGDSTVIDLAVPGLAYSFEAIPFRGKHGNGNGNDGNRQYEFDGEEYAEFPEKLATNFLAPDRDGTILGEMILFTLDGRLNPNAAAEVDIYNDDENYSWTDVPEFTCMIAWPLEEPFYDDTLGSDVGHLVLTPKVVSYDDEVHDEKFGDGNEQRRTPIHGWIVQGATTGASLTGASSYLYGDPAWGRALAHSNAPLPPWAPDEDEDEDEEDEPALDAGCEWAPCPQ